MTSSSSDEWLLALLDEKSPDEFTPAELEALRSRAAVSHEIRQAIVERIRLEESLHAMLADVPIEARDVLPRSRSMVPLTAVAALAAVLFAVGGLWWWQSSWPDAGRDVAPQVATQQERRDEERSVNPVASRRELVPVEAPRPTRPVVSEPTVASAEPPAAREPQPWEALLGDEARVVPFAESAVAAFGDTPPGFEVTDEFPASELNRWIAAVPGRPFTVNEGQWRGRRFAALEGVARLRPSWRSDAVLRIAPFDIGEFALTFWNGNSGVMVRYYPHQRPQQLAAYAVTRDAAGAAPTSYRLVTTDSGRFARSNAGAMEVRHQDGQLVVTRGALPLLVVPGVAVPDDVLIAGRMKLRTLSMHRGEPAVLADVAPTTNLFGEARVGELDWTTSNDPPPQLERSDDRVTLTWNGKKSDGGRKAVWAGVRLPAEAPVGLCEVVFRMESLAPGTGVYLGDADGRPVHTLFAARNDPAKTPVLSFGWSNREGNVPEPRWQWNVDPQQELTPAVGAGTWVKLVIGEGGLKTFVSGDGRHWGFASRAPERNARGPFASIGVFAIADEQPRSIAVSSVELRELSALASSADADLRKRVPDFHAKRSADWLARVIATRPEGVSETDWLRASSVETLARGAADDVLRFALDGLIRETIASDRPIDEIVAVLHEAALLSDQWSDQSRRFSEYYQQLARHRVDRAKQPSQAALEMFAVLEGAMAAPLWSESVPAPVPSAAMRNLAAMTPWASSASDGSTTLSEARDAAERAACLILPSHPESGWSAEEDSGLVRMTAWAARASTGNADLVPSASRSAWRHPLVTTAGREAQTLAAELETALSDGAYDDAVNLLSAIADLADLVPAPGDPNRFVRPAGLIAEVAARQPDLIAALSRKFGETGMLHVRQSIAAGDENAVREAAIRYFGTPAAAEAHRWLGERDLAIGRFLEAESHFAAAMVVAPDVDRATLVASRRLAAALAGKTPAGEPAGPATFGSQTLDPAALERLVEELRQARAVDANASHPEPVAIPDAVSVALQPRGRLEGDVGRGPGKGEYRRFDWAGRQIAVVLDRDTAYITNRFQIVAYDLARKSPAWSVGLGNEQGEAHALPNVAFRPIVHGERLYARRLLGRGAELACLDLTSRGKVLWRSESRLVFASDPVLEAGVLTAVTSASTARSGGPFTLSLTRLRADDGGVIDAVPLLVLNAIGDAKPSAQLVATGDGFLITTDGTVARCDAQGRLVWIRRLPHLPATADLDADRLPPGPPLLLDDRVVIAPPGGRAIVCLERESGRLVWTRPLGELDRLAGVAGSKIIARLSDAVMGLDPATGATAWVFRRENLLHGLRCDAETVLVTARTPLENRRDGLSLLRVDAATGRLKSEQVLRVDRKDEVRCGPLFVHEKSVWGFVGDGWRDPSRALVEFAADPAQAAVATAIEPGPYDAWIGRGEPPTAFHVTTALPGWRLIGSPPGQGATSHDEHRGERSVLQTQAGGTRATHFVRRLELRPGQKLTARVGREDDEGWTLRLLGDGVPFASEPVNKQTAPDGWRTVTFDLTPVVGRPVVLALEQAPPADKADRATKANWKQVVIE